jgi:hypothetical protein
MYSAGGPVTVRPFSFAHRTALVSPVRMKRPTLRALLVTALLVAAVFAVWSWLRPYAWRVDPAARCKVVGSQVKKDQSYYWLDVHLKVSPGKAYDLMKPVRLVASSGRELEPADTTLGGKTGEGTTELWFKFWLEPSDFEGPLKLRVNDGSLEIRSGAGIPQLGSSNLEYFTTSGW